MGRWAEQGCVCLSLKKRTGAQKRAPRCHHTTRCRKPRLLCRVPLIVWENCKVFFCARNIERGLRGCNDTSLSPPPFLCSLALSPLGASQPEYVERAPSPISAQENWGRHRPALTDLPDDCKARAWFPVTIVFTFSKLKSLTNFPSFPTFRGRQQTDQRPQI